jgi:acetyl esterase/lipase
MKIFVRAFAYSLTACSLTICGLAAAPSAFAQQTVLPLWPHATPEPAQTTDPERDVTTDKDALIDGRRTERLTNVTSPTITVYPPSGVKNTGAAALVFPGGGYARLAWNGEGTDTCDWLNSIGMTCLLVKYRVPEKGRYPDNPADLEDAQQAMRLARAHASDWHIDPVRIGVVGFSAGAHLAVTLGAHWDDTHVESTLAAADVDTKIDARPNFSLVIYPAYVATPPALTEIDPALVPVAKTPPTFLLQAEDDGVHVENSLIYYRALKEAKVPVEMHLYSTGGHGFGVRPPGKPEEHWTILATIWLRSLGVIPSLAPRHGPDRPSTGVPTPTPCPTPTVPQPPRAENPDPKSTSPNTNTNTSANPNTSPATQTAQPYPNCW